MFGREGDFPSIQDCSASSPKPSKAALSGPNITSTSSTTPWSRLSSKDPRIVRVSRAFGGKDRHSKVCTVKGLRDRRVRLSVPTAIQLYDLQDRLGLSQPSKVVDWLLDAAKHEIDELPPLQIPQGFSFTHNLLPNPDFLEFGDSQYSKQGLELMTRAGPSGEVGWSDQDPSSPGRNYKASGFRGKSAHVPVQTGDHHGHETSSRNREEQRQLIWLENPDAYVNSAANAVFSRQNPSSSSPSFVHGAHSTYNSQFAGWDPSSLTLSQPVRSRGLDMDRRQEDVDSFSRVSMPLSALISAPSNHQILGYRGQGANEQAYVRPFHFSMAANLLPSDKAENGGRH